MRSFETDFGFVFGAMEVVRVTEIHGYTVIDVRTDKHAVEITASPHGNRLRIKFKDGTTVTLK